MAFKDAKVQLMNLDHRSGTTHTRLLVIFMTVFIDLVGFGIILPLSPFLAREFNASALQIGY